MNGELQVVVTQNPGTVDWNFEELKEALKKQMEIYNGMVFDTNSIRDAKSTLVDLRKLREAVEKRRKEIKNACLAPYALIETQAKELTALIDEPINFINAQVKEQEENRRREAQEKIYEYWRTASAELPGDLRDRLYLKVYSDKWLNATAKKSEWMTAIDGAVAGVMADISAIDELEPEFRPYCMNAYRVRLVLSDAMTKANELRRQKQQLMEWEKKRREDEAARRAAQQEAASAPEIAQPVAPIVEAKQVSAESKPQEVSEKPSEAEREADVAGRYTIHVDCTEAQYNKILGYIKFIGAAVR